MSKIQVKNLAGKDVKEVELPALLFDQVSNDTLLHQVYVALTSNLRQVLAHTKDRSERRGGGKKPWKQKGTGRARAGSSRSPIWRKGGITFGPNKNRNFSKKTTTNMRQKATLIALSEKFRSGKLIILDTFEGQELKTKYFSESLHALGVNGRSMIIGFDITEKQTERALQNIPRVHMTLSENLNVKDLLDNEYLIVSLQSLTILEKRFVTWNS
jgi:large subunit ribosomal protein L4